MLNTGSVTHRLKGQLKIFMNVKLYLADVKRIHMLEKTCVWPSVLENDPLSLKLSFTQLFVVVVFRSGINFLHCRFTMITHYKPDTLQTRAYFPVLLNLYLLVFKLFCACIRITYFIYSFFFLCFFSKSLQTLVESF